MGETLSAPSPPPPEAPWLADPIVKAAPAASTDAPWLADPIVKFAPVSDPELTNQPAGIPGFPQPVANIAAAGIKGAVQGFGDPIGQTILSPKAQEMLDAKQREVGFGGRLAHLGSTVATDIGTVGGVVAGIGNAAFRGAQGVVAQTGEELGAPQLGRDIAAIPEAFMGSPEMLGMGPTPTELPLANRPFVPRTAEQGNLLANVPRPTDPLPLPTPGVPLNTLADFGANGVSQAPNALAGTTPTGWSIDDRFGATPAAASPYVPITSTQVQRRDGVGAIEAGRRADAENAAATAPAPESAGAAASRDLTNPNLLAMTPREAAASQATGESWRLAQPAVQGVDKTEYVKGVVPTAAETTGNADVAGEQKFVVQTPGMAEQNRLQQARNNDARTDHYDNLAGTQTIVNTMEEARNAQADKDLTAAWSNKQPVDAQPIVDQIDAVLAGPQGKLSAVKSALTSIRNTLHDADGNLESDPETLYGARREVANMLGKAAQVEKPTLKDAARQIGTVKDALDQAIESGAPGYKQYLDNYSAASKPINARQLLLDARPDLTSGSGRMMTFGKMDRLMKGIVEDRQAPGVNAAKSIDEDTMEGLWNLHSDLKRMNNIDLGKPRGSDTSSLVRKGASLAGLGGAHMVANTLLPVVGPFLVKQGHEMLEKGKLQGRMNKLMDGMNYPTPKN